jgi:alpha-tubulin suppressor-like RCC1 family protein
MDFFTPQDTMRLQISILIFQNGQLGDGTIVNRNTPTKVLLDQNIKVKQMSGGETSSLILTTTGMVYGFGLNHVGQLGDGTGLTRLIPTPIVYQNQRVAKICSGAYHSLVVKRNGKLYGFGYNVVRIIF